MESYNLAKIGSLEANSTFDSSERCDVCGSMDIVETYEGYTCQECGIVLEVQKLEYHRPYDKDILQHAVIGKTLIGTKGERFGINSLARFEALNKLDIRRSHEEIVVNAARTEIKRIITALKLPNKDISPLLERFKFIHSQIAKGTKYRNPTMLVPSVIYAFYKEKSKPIRERAIGRCTHLKKGLQLV